MFSNFFGDDDFDFFGSPRTKHREGQKTQSTKPNTIPVKVHKSQKRSSQQPQKKKQHPKELKTSNHSKTDRKLKTRAATKIQKVFRGYQTRKLELIPKLKQLSKIESEYDDIKEKFWDVKQELHQLWNKKDEDIDFLNYRITHRKLLECEEEMTRLLIALDSIPSQKSQLIRSRRKHIVDSVTAGLLRLEPVKKRSIQKLKQLEERHNFGHSQSPQPH